MHKSLVTKLRAAINSVRAEIPFISFDTTRAAHSDIRTGYLDGHPVRRLVITLRAPGCTWTVESGGCAMCGHWAGTTRGVLPSTVDTLAQFTGELKKYDLSNITVLSIYNSGSMLNPGELAPETLTAMLRHIRSIPSIRKVILETRAEYADRVYVSELAAILAPHARLSIAMGLETFDDQRRELCLNKGVTGKEIATAAAGITDIAEVQLYVLAGLPFLTEAEAIEDAVTSLEYANQLGASEIHIEPLTIQRYTFVELLASLGIVTLPSLYSIYEILRCVVPGVRPYVSPFMHMPLPDKIPGGCPLCTRPLIDGLLNRYNLTRDRISLEYEHCACIDTWRSSLTRTDPRPLEKRISDALDSITCRVSTC